MDFGHITFIYDLIQTLELDGSKLIYFFLLQLKQLFNLIWTCDAHYRAWFKNCDSLILSKYNKHHIYESLEGNQRWGLKSLLF